jgi:hypothetical protein
MLTDADLEATFAAHHPHAMVTDIGANFGGTPVGLGECEQVGELVIESSATANDNPDLGGTGLDGGGEGQFEIGLVLPDGVAVHDRPALR